MTGYKIEKAEVYRVLLGEISKSLDIDDIVKRIFKNIGNKLRGRDLAEISPVFCKKMVLL